MRLISGAVVAAGDAVCAQVLIDEPVQLALHVLDLGDVAEHELTTFAG
jgi:hypothetical protein